MNRLHTSLSGTLCVALLGAGPATQPTSPTDTSADLCVHAEALSHLKERLQNSSKPPRMLGGMLVAPEPNVDSQVRVSPPYVTPQRDWVAKQFNGLTYYLIPCDGTHPATTSRGERVFDTFPPAKPIVAPTTRPAR